MTKEDKDLLLKDLCGRLPYGVKIQHPVYDEPQELDTIFNYDAYVDGIIQCACDDIDEIVEHKNSLTSCRPYLRPMSSMTEDEKKVLELCNAFVEPRSIELKVDFYNRQHLDFRGLIEKGLAIEASEGMYKND